MTAELVVALVALVVAFLALGRDTFEHRQNSAGNSQGLLFRHRRGPFLEVDTDGVETWRYKLSAEAAGPGTRYDVRTLLWCDDKIEPKWLDLRREVPRFDNTYGELSISEIVVEAKDTDRVWFGISYVEASSRMLSDRTSFRTQFVRSNIGTGDIQVWRWYRCESLRTWWQQQSRLSVLGGGVPKPLGCWKSVRQGEFLPGQSPVWQWWAQKPQT